MACNITLAGITQDCTGSLGGIREAYMIPYADMGTFTITDGAVAGWTAAGISSWFKYEFRRNTSSFTTTLSKDDSTGTFYWTTEIVLQFLKQEAVKREEVEQLAVGEMAMIVKDSNGNYWLFGYEEGVVMADGSTAETGTAKSDFNGYNLTFTDESTILPMSVNADVMDSIYPNS